MNRKNGFTITELLAVIVVLGIISVIGVASYNGIKTRVLTKQYENTVTLALNKASQYAADNEENDTIFVTVNDLIELGYLDADDENGLIYNPKENKKNINCYVIKISYENGQYKAVIDKEIDSEMDSESQNSCNNAISNNLSITFYCTINGETETCNKDIWYLDNVSISIGMNNNEDISNSLIEWSSLTGAYKMIDNSVNTVKDYSITTLASSTLNTIYSVTITNGDNIYKAKQIIKIDKQNPEIIKQSFNYNDEIAEERTITIEATDYSGSGIKGYYFYDKFGDKECNNSLEYQSSNKYTYEEEQEGVKDYTICINDNAGNIKKELVSVKAIEPVPLVAPTITASDNIVSAGWHSQDFSLTFTGGKYYSYSFDNNSYQFLGITNTMNIKLENNGKTIYLKTCNKNPTKCSEYSSYVIKFDTTPPKCELTINNGYIKFNNLETNANYGISSPGSTNYSTSVIINKTGTYSGYVQDVAGNKSFCSVNVTSTYQSTSISYSYSRCVCYHWATSKEISNRKCSDTSYNGAHGAYESNANNRADPTCWIWFESNYCPDNFPLLQSLESCKSKLPVQTTTYYCSSGTKLNDNYCYTISNNIN